ncbi:DUF3817 domain-containing protein [Rufibacter sediminis]|uniref:DUF3817 domain-containing protein n=1 Tax=Rufibacter sediminis TaxID=2762756 RepID=A0ABR6VRY2_9BACT|nr:DUF3817 domain-containing protein [Rufibacter sediminis]MBC3539959.1 DUF3817 domain-containing protein [Rufibacter sediminis]
MNFALNTSLGRFRLIAIIEGISYLVLLFIAMPMKYLGGMEKAVKYPGMVHGVLFVLFAFLLLQVWIEYRWSFKKAVAAFFWSLVPFGTFYFDKKIAQDQPNR